MEASEFRQRFASFAGVEEFQKLLHFLNQEGRWLGRFRFWQEELLSQFADAVGSFDPSFNRVEPLLRICELHGTDLCPDLEAWSTRCRGGVTDDTLARAERSPNLDCGPIVVGNRRDNHRQGLWYCPACRAIDEKSMATEVK